jgi:hypothetical protein
VAGNYAYIAAGDLYIIDVNMPSAPVIVGFYDTEGAVGVAVNGNYAYVADSFGANYSMRTIDVSVPEAPTEVGFYITPSSARSVATAGGFAYVTSNDAGLFILEYKPSLLVYLPLVMNSSSGILTPSHPSSILGDG